MSEQRKYSISEIDRMRSALEWSYGGGVYNAAARSAEVEDRLRTYMLNGTDPEELEERTASRRNAEHDAAVAAGKAWVEYDSSGRVIGEWTVWP